MQRHRILAAGLLCALTLTPTVALSEAQQTPGVIPIGITSPPPPPPPPPLSPLRPTQDELTVVVETRFTRTHPRAGDKMRIESFWEEIGDPFTPGPRKRERVDNIEPEEQHGKPLFEFRNGAWWTRPIKLKIKPKPGHVMVVAATGMDVNGGLQSREERFY